jgi:hypothetical protein
MKWSILVARYFVAVAIIFLTAFAFTTVKVLWEMHLHD